MSAADSPEKSRPNYGLLRLLGASVIFGLLFWIIDPRELLAALARTDPLLVAALFGLSIIWLLLGALNVWILLRRRSEISLPAFAEVYVTSWSIGLLIPGQLGDASQILLLRRHGIAAASSAAAYTVDKLVSLAMFGLIGTYGVARFSAALAPGEGLAISAGVALLIASAAFVTLKLIPVSRLPQRVRDVVTSVSSEVALITARPGLIGLNMSISTVKWLLMACMYYTVFAALGVIIAFEPAATIPVVSSLVAYIPVTVGGIGTMEWTAVGLFHGVGIAPVDVVGAYLVMRGTLIACAAAILAVGKVAGHARSH